MNRLSLITTLAAAGIVLAAGGYYEGRRASGTGAAPVAGAASAPGDRKVLYWHDPMVPGQRFDKPGKSPYMDMALVPVYADPAGDSGDSGDSGVRISPIVEQNLGIRTATVRREEVASSFDAVGSVQYDERLGVAVQTRVAGYVEHLSARAPMERVRKGQALATIFAPDWLGPQNELLALKRAGVSPDLVAAARDRTRAMSIPDALVRRSEETDTAQARFTLVAPVSGVVTELGVREGVVVSPGTTLFRIAGLEKVWAVVEIPEEQALRLTRGQRVKASLQADPSRTFSGRLTEILPQINATTRTLQARFEVDNREGRLTPGMLLRVQVAGPSSSGLVVPSEAVIRTGKRAVVIVRKESGAFESRDVAIGQEVGHDIEVTRGLAEGEQVVASGQFLIDSEARLRSVTENMSAPAATEPASAASMPAAQGSGVHVGQGKVESVDANTLVISHGPVASLNWPAMTMGFGKPDPGAFADVKPGDTVRFEFRQEGPAGYELVSVKRLGAAQ